MSCHLDKPGCNVYRQIERLLESEKGLRAEAEKASRAKDDFLALLSHELRTPLTAIRMFADTLREGRLEGEATREEYLDTIVSESERLSRLEIGRAHV